ncbi:hypothetical protein [Vibrio ulleungensis]|uniref:Uncharacterized protein n=1 Tax=Vibrio ulleungensis TaxID=2807619 RepID=A0ABS2HDF3_9VIBR|nr:hypothetical protein [Vibrio ulleungensis]MBM7035615.1 hypothetical protein [Vibrio ulleungensis]
MKNESKKEADLSKLSQEQRDILELQQALMAIENRQAKNQTDKNERAEESSTPETSTTEAPESNTTSASQSPECELLLALADEVKNSSNEEFDLEVVKKKLAGLEEELKNIPIAVGIGLFTAGLLVGRTLK